MKSIIPLFTLAALCLASSAAFMPQLSSKHTFGLVSASKTKLNGFFNDDGERKKLTRDNEPEEYFATNTDKMTDEEKIPIAIVGFLGISLPFIVGMIALYAAK